MSNEIKFIKLTITTCLVVLLASGLFNFVIDPYNIFQIVRLQGINTSKAGADDRIGFSKTYMAKKTNPVTIILGTSKFDIGIDPANRYIPNDMKPAFNFAVPGTSIYSQYRNLQHVGINQRAKLVIMGLGFESFLTDTYSNEIYPPARQEFEDRLAFNYDGSVNQARTIKALKDYSAALLSNSALNDSFNTIFSANTVWLDQSGLSSGQVRFGSRVQNKGHYSVFRNMIRKQLINEPGNKVVNENSKAFKALDDLIHYGKKNNLDLIFILPPDHAFQLELWNALGLWNEFEKWKQLLVSKIEAYKNDNFKIEIHDYSFHNVMTIEDVPPLSDLTPMQGYWESIHFKKQLGDIMLEEIFTRKKNSVGVLLNSDNLCKHLHNMRRNQNRYFDEKQQQVNLFNEIVSNNKFTASRVELVGTDRITCSK